MSDEAKTEYSDLLNRLGKASFMELRFVNETQRRKIG